MSVSGMFSGNSGDQPSNKSVFYEAVMFAKSEKRRESVNYYTSKYEDQFDDFGYFSSDVSASGGNVMNNYNGGDDEFWNNDSSDSVIQPEPKGSFGFNGLSAFGGIDFTKLAEGDESGDLDFEAEPVERSDEDQIELSAFIDENTSSSKDDESDFFNDFDQKVYTQSYGEAGEEHSWEDAVVMTAPAFEFEEQELDEDFELEDEYAFGGSEEENEAELELEELEEETLPEKSKRADSAVAEQVDFKEGIYNGRVGKYVAFAVAMFAALLLLFSLSVFMVITSVLGNGEIYDGVCVNGMNLGGMTKEEAVVHVSDTYVAPIKNAGITITLGDVSKEYTLDNFVICPDVNTLVEEAYNVARTGNVFKRMEQIERLKKSNVNFPVSYEIVSDKLNDVISSATNISFAEPVNPEYKITGSSVVFYGGKKGSNIDKAKFQTELYEALNEFKDEIVQLKDGAVLEDMEVTIDTTEVSFKALSPQEIYDAVYKKSADAYFYRNTAGEIVIGADTLGQEVDSDSLNKIVSDINYNGLNYAELDIEVTTAAYTADALRKKLYDTTLSTSTSTNGADVFSSTAWVGKEERDYNFKKYATAFGYVELLPGEKLDFLAEIGNVSLSAGYREAYENMYNGGKKFVGAGISQAASVVYTAARKANLTMVNHYNSYYTPNYGVIGFDAYVNKSEGKNLIIQNTTEFPVKFSMKYENGTLSVKIEGTNEGLGKISLAANETSKTYDKEGTRYTYAISTVAGNKVSSLGNVSYVTFGEEFVSDATATPEATLDPDSSETPTGTFDPDASETPTGTMDPDSSETPTGTIDPDSSETPTGTFDPFETTTPEATVDPYGSESPSETPTGTFEPDSSETPTGSIVPDSSETPSATPEVPSESERPTASPDYTEEPTETAAPTEEPPVEPSTAPSAEPAWDFKPDRW